MEGAVIRCTGTADSFHITPVMSFGFQGSSRGIADFDTVVLMQCICTVSAIQFSCLDIQDRENTFAVCRHGKARLFCQRANHRCRVIPYLKNHTGICGQYKIHFRPVRYLSEFDCRQRPGAPEGFILTVQSFAPDNQFDLLCFSGNICHGETDGVVISFPGRCRDSRSFPVERFTHGVFQRDCYFSADDCRRCIAGFFFCGGLCDFDSLSAGQIFVSGTVPCLSQIAGKDVMSCFTGIFNKIG